MQASHEEQLLVALAVVEEDGELVDVGAEELVS